MKKKVSENGYANSLTDQQSYDTLVNALESNPNTYQGYISYPTDI